MDFKLGYVIFSVIAVLSFSFLVSTFPSEFTYSGDNTVLDEPDNVVSMSDAGVGYQYTVNDTLVFTDSKLFDFNPSFNAYFRVQWLAYVTYITINEYAWQWGDIYQLRMISEPITKDYLVAHWDEDSNMSKFEVYGSELILHVEVMDSDMERNDIEDAWDDGSVEIYLNFGYDDFSLQWTGFSLLVRFLTFQPIAGLPTWIQYLVNIFLYTNIGYLLFAIITTLIPFIG